MELYIYGGTSQLPSIDFDCLRTVVYVRLHAAHVIIHSNGNPFHSPNGFLPYLKCADESKVAGYDEIVEYLQTNGYGKSDYLLSSHICELESKLIPFMKYTLWGDPANTETTRMIYAERLKCPFNFIYPPRYKQQTLDFLLEMANFSIDDKIEFHNTTELIFNAKRTINMIAERIGTKLWFLDNSRGPTEIDANIYAILTILHNLHPQSSEIKNHIGSYPNLLKYIERIRGKYLSDLCTKVVAKPSEKSDVFQRMKNVFVNKEEGTISDLTLKIVFTMLTIGTMVGFAMTQGIIEFSFDDDDGYAEHLQYDENNDE